MITDAALRRTTRDVVLHAKSFKHLDVAAVHLYGNRNDQLSLGILQHMPHRGFEVQVVSRAIELLFGNFEGIELFLESLLSRHAFSSWERLGGKALQS